MSGLFECFSKELFEIVANEPDDLFLKRLDSALPLQYRRSTLGKEIGIIKRKAFEKLIADSKPEENRP